MSDDTKGTFICYVPKTFSDEHRKIIGIANAIIDEYGSYAISLRQLYYQFVARGLLPNRQSEYNRLGGIINDARLAGLVSWTAIEDRNRGLQGDTYFDSPAAVLKQARDQYQLDKWCNQDWRPEVWVEKAALIGVVEPVCRELGIDYFACRGYNSQSEQWRAGRRFQSYISKGQRPIVFHLGDHDPSGIDMTRDNRDRLTMFAGVPVMVVRLALNMPQIEEYEPPPNPAKWTDSRAASYVEQFGESSWELDALPPDVLAGLVRDAVLKLRDEDKWAAMLAEEAEDRDTLDLILDGLDKEDGE